MTPYLTREEYNRLVILAGLGDIPAEAADVLVSREYPKSTGAAAAELRTRNLDVDLHVLYRAAAAGKFTAPQADGDNLKWSPTQIDAAAEHFDEEGRLTPKGAACLHFGIDAGQLLAAEQAAMRAGHQLDGVVMIVTPGAVGRGIPAKVSFRPMTDEEAADLRAITSKVPSR